MDRLLVELAVIIPLICYFTYTSVYRPHPITCDMEKPENRDFSNFYGISELENPFATAIADGCSSNIAFKSVLPQAVLKSDKSASSFMVLAKYGTGKTLLRCQYYNTLQSNGYFKILILNKQLNEYLERFVAEVSANGKNCKSADCVEGWSQNDFAQLILSLLVTHFVDRFYEEKFTLPDITLDEKIDLITIICYYYNEQGVNKLENFVNSFLKKAKTFTYSSNTANVHIGEQNKSVDKPLLIQFKKDLNKFNALSRDYKKLVLLLAVVEGEDFQNQIAGKKMSDNIMNDLTHLTLFMKNQLKKPVVFIIDGIDENKYFFHSTVVNKRSFELFFRSSISQEILSAVMAQNFYLSLFYPEIDGINVQDAIIRKDKFPVYKIEWNTESLINYADYLLEEMNKNASTTRCKALPDFKKLISYDNTQIAELFSEIQTPRILHYIMIELIREMNSCAKDMKEPFIATYGNFKTAIKKSNEYLYKRSNAV